MAAFEIRKDLNPPARAGSSVATEFTDTFAKLVVGEGLIFPLSDKLKDPYAPYKKVARDLQTGGRYRWWESSLGYGAVKRVK
jgi:hypothetical protein